MSKTAKLKISGAVQGVGLRYTITQYAKENDYKGWVRNEPDGTVICCLECGEEKLNKFIDWLKGNKSIPGINQVQANWEESDMEHEDFMIRY